MKKLILSIAVIAVFVFTSCSSDDDGGKSCEQLFNETLAAAEAYVEIDNEANCIAYRTALQAYLDKECPGSEVNASIIAELGDCTE